MTAHRHPGQPIHVGGNLRYCAIAALGVVCWHPGKAHAQTDSLWLDGLTSGSLGWLALVLAFLSCTSFLKLSIVLSALRGGLGMEGTPSTAAVTALSVILSLLIMAPIAEEMASIDGERREMHASESIDWSATLAPLQGFMTRNTRTSEAALLERLASTRGLTGDNAAAADWNATFTRVIPAFMLTELSEAFQIALLLLLPFVVIDIVVASMITSLGLQGLRPNSVGVPMKLLLFIVVDGWALLTESLVLGYV